MSEEEQHQQQQQQQPHHQEEPQQEQGPDASTQIITIDATPATETPTDFLDHDPTKQEKQEVSLDGFSRA